MLQRMKVRKRHQLKSQQEGRLQCKKVNITKSLTKNSLKMKSLRSLNLLQMLAEGEVAVVVDQQVWLHLQGSNQLRKLHQMKEAQTAILLLNQKKKSRHLSHPIPIMNQMTISNPKDKQQLHQGLVVDAGLEEVQDLKESDVDSHLLRKSLKKSHQAKNGGGKKEVKGGEQENESKNTKVNLHLTLRQMILNLPKKGEKERSQQDLQRTFSYLLNWQLLLVLVRLLDTRL